MYLLQAAKCLLSACSSRTKATADVPHGVQHLRKHHQRGALHLHDHTLHSVAVSMPATSFTDTQLPHTLVFFPLFTRNSPEPRAYAEMSSMTINRNTREPRFTSADGRIAVDTPPSDMSPPRRRTRARPRSEVTARSRCIVLMARPRVPLRHRRPSASSSARTRRRLRTPRRAAAGGNSSSSNKTSRPRRWWTAGRSLAVTSLGVLGGHRGCPRTGSLVAVSSARRT